MLEQKILNKVHNVQLDIMDEIHRVCEENNINYFLVGGSLIGAVRHDGFIPWDDDLDIGMFREDYDKFIDIAKSKLKEEFFLDYFSNKEDSYLPFAKIRKKDTLYEEKGKEKYNGPKQIWVDIFPFDGVKKKKSFMLKIKSKMLKLSTSILGTKLGIERKKNVKILKVLSKIIPRKFLLGIYKMVENNTLENTYVADFASLYSIDKEVYDKSVFYPVQKHRFENKQYYIPNDYDSILTQVYGKNLIKYKEVDVMAKVSVIMPVYNSEKYLKKAIESIITQSFYDIELILIDDGSKDNSGKICDEYKNKDNRVKVIHKSNGGICDARNAGLKIATGDYIMFCDNDDEYLEDMISDNYNLAVENNADVVKFGSNSIFIRDGNFIKKDIRKFKFDILDTEQIKENIIDLIYKNALLCVWDGIFKKDIIIDFNTKLKSGMEDTDFMFNVIKKVKKLVLNDKVYYNHFVRNTHSTSVQYRPEKIEDKKYMYSKFLELTNNLVNEQDIPKYNIIITREYFTPVLDILVNKKCELKNKEKLQILQKVSIKYEECRFKDMYKLSKKYAIIQFMARKKMYLFLLAFAGLYRKIRR